MDPRESTYQKRLEIGFADLRERWPAAPAQWSEDALTICGHPVMERWEDGYMRELARIAASRGGAVLEVGFGMGISASYLQRQAIAEHVIIEANADVFHKVEKFADGARVPVQALFGFWEDVVPRLAAGSVSGILFDTYPLVPEDVHRNHFAFFREAHRLLKPGGVLTYYSDEPYRFSDEHLACLKRAGFSRIGAVTCRVKPPEDCQYWKSGTILAPIVVK